MTEDDDGETEEEPLSNLVDEVGDDGGAEDTPDVAPTGENDEGANRRNDDPDVDPMDLNDPVVDPGGTDDPDVDPGGLPGTGEPGSGSDAGESEPLGDLASRVDERRSRDRDEPEEDLFDRAFEDVGVEDADTEALWEDLESGSLDTAVETPEVETEGETYVVDKREYCLRCQHFSDPPEVRCEAEDSEILEVSDTDDFRVRGCPIVEGEEDLQNLGR